jgi:hypothetical protein
MTKRMNYTLWTVQSLLALLFLFTGVVKLVLPVAELTKQMALPGPFLRFLGAAEVLGAAGLVLPGMLGIRRGLTPLAAAGLVIIMMGATVCNAAYAGAGPAFATIVVGMLAGLVAWKRSGIAESYGREQCLSSSRS